MQCRERGNVGRGVGGSEPLAGTAGGDVLQQRAPVGALQRRRQEGGNQASAGRDALQ
jgi:hypothetical protein